MPLTTELARPVEALASRSVSPPRGARVDTTAALKSVDRVQRLLAGGGAGKVADHVEAAIGTMSAYTSGLKAVSEAAVPSERVVEDHLRGLADDLHATRNAVRIDAKISPSLKDALKAAHETTVETIDRARFAVPTRAAARPVTLTKLTQEDLTAQPPSAPIRKIMQIIDGDRAHTAAHPEQRAQSIDANYWHIGGIEGKLDPVRTPQELQRALAVNAGPPKNGTQYLAESEGKPVALIRPFTACALPSGTEKELEWVPAHEHRESPELHVALEHVIDEHFAKNDHTLVGFVGPDEPDFKRMLRALKFTPDEPVKLYCNGREKAPQFFTLYTREKAPPTA